MGDKSVTRVTARAKRKRNYTRFTGGLRIRTLRITLRGITLPDERKK